MIPELGYSEGDVCGRNGCKGHIEIHPVENCSCHLSAPCSACTSPRNYCPKCEWEESEEFIMNDLIITVNEKSGIYRSYGLRPLDNTKIDWHSKSHSSCSMIKEGVYPEGTTLREVEELVKGTFGGRFEHFENGKFRYIAYTD